MSDSFLLATRIPMTRADFERWLDTPAPEPGEIANPGAVFDGWYWNGKAPAWQHAETGITPREYLADCIDDGGYGLTYIVGHRDGALEAYLMHFGFCESNIYTLLPMFAAAGKLSSDTEPSTVLFWAETSGSLREADWQGWLSTLSVGPAGARFTPEVDLAAAIAGLRPAEQRFYDLVRELARVEESPEGADESAHLDRDPRYADPALFADRE
ncbi:hypothetical protein JK358_22950 [Nocardia sp. 2]|uniref:SMI1/KNR4 family protein n=1 Tax=Nocardia acididurans TaxID=2802282 RepID=A0ABS1M9E5_9NOCA|nr:hypothetical protein [Nocardia acididurans]MBL1077263.1 hypothetical protein [Nocardia acididurans]